MSGLQAVGRERFLVWMTSFSDEGEPYEWCVEHADSAEAASARVVQMMVHHSSDFASAFRIERVVIADAGERRPFVGRANPGAPSEEPAADPEPTRAPEVPW